MLLCRTIVSAADRDRLLAAIAKARGSWLTFAPYLDLFRANLRRAQVLPAGEVPDDVITMNSCFSVTDARTGESNRFKLVYPDEPATSWDNALSVLTPMGIAVLGAAVGDEVCWTSSQGPEVATVESVIYQPEAAGHYRRREPVLVE